MGNIMNRGFRQNNGAPDAVENDHRPHRMILREHARHRAANRAVVVREESARLEAARRERLHGDAARRDNGARADRVDELLRGVVDARQEARREREAREEAARGDNPDGEDDMDAILREVLAVRGDAPRREAVRGEANRGDEAIANEARAGVRARRVRPEDLSGDEDFDDFVRGIAPREGARRGEAARGEADRGGARRGGVGREEIARREARMAEHQRDVENARREARRAEAARVEGIRHRAAPRIVHGEVERRNARRAAAAMAAIDLERLDSDEEIDVVRERAQPVAQLIADRRLNRRQRQRGNRQRIRIPEGLRHAQPNPEQGDLEDQQRAMFELLVWQEDHDLRGGGDEHHPNFPRVHRERHRIQRGARNGRDNRYYLTAAREIDYTTTCPFCKEGFQNRLYLAHLDTCPRAMDDYRDKLAEVHLFNSGIHIFHRDLFKLRETCELSYFEAILAPPKIINMFCVLCKTHTDHMTGKCLRNQMRAVFMKKATIIGTRILAHYEQNLELIKQKAIDELLVKHGDYFESVEAFLTDEPADLDTEHQRQAAWFDFKQRSASQTMERTRLIDKESEKSQALFLTKKNEVTRTIESFCNSMVQYIHETMFSERLPEIVNNRRANPLFQEAEQNVQAPREEAEANAELEAPNVAGELNRFFEQFRREDEEQLGYPAVARRVRVNAR